MNCLRNTFLFTFICVCLLFCSSAVKADSKKKSSKKTTKTVSKNAELVIDASTGEILYQVNATAKRYPASLTKLMTLYLTFDALKKNNISLSEKVKVSKHASLQPRMNLDLKSGEKLSIQTLISSLVVLSANDSAVVLAEKIGGTESKFATLMTTQARELGMKNTTFKNASGLYDPNQITTAYDMALLMQAIKKDFPEYYNMLSALNFTYDGVEYHSHTNVMKVYSWAKAGKTGYVRASGFNLVIGAQKNDQNIVAVVMGGATAKIRDDKMIKLLDKFL